MSFESFRAGMISRLSPVLPEDHLQEVLRALDDMAQSWEFTPKSTAIITSGGMPDEVRNYLACKSIENIRKSTLQNYYYLLRMFFDVVRLPVEQVTAVEARKFLAWYKTNRNVTNDTLNHKRIILNSFFDWCADEYPGFRNPMKHIKPIKCEDPERLPMTALELERVRRSCRTVREKALVDFLYSTAARVSEVCDLDIDDISFTDHTVHIRCGKGGKGRTTFMNAEAEVSLRAYLESRQDDNQALFVSANKPHGRMKKRAVELEIMKIVSRCEISVHVTPHVFRHTAASLALQRGMPIDQVQKWLGHARIQTTLRYAKTLNFDVKLAHQKYCA